MLSQFDWGNTKLPRSENKTGLPFAWVKIKISALKKFRGIYLVQCALREAGEVVDYIHHLRNEGLGARKIQKFRFF